MGQDIEKTDFSQADFARFRSRLDRNLQGFKRLLEAPGFGEGPVSFGAELELYIVDGQARPLPINTRLQQLANDDQLTLELNQFNLEYNFTPLIQQSNPFGMMRQQMDAALDHLSHLGKQEGARILPIGILPTLRSSDMGLDAITDVPRYHVLARALRNKRGKDFHIDIRGHDTVEMDWADVSPEGANTSFQFHYRVNPADFAASYNAAQLCTPLVLALAANSPLFLGKQLWHETRIALFQQSIDYRMDDALEKQLPARVLFGLGWVRKDIYELFAEGVYLFEPLMPIISESDSLQAQPGEGPSLYELRLHQGSIWSWNRPIYDPSDNGHLRIEIRALPAGPTPANMVANAALIAGLMRGMRDQMDTLLAGIPFRYAEQNFHRAAKHGLDATLFWPNPKSSTLEERPVREILHASLPVAEEGLLALGVSGDDVRTQLDIIRGGLERNMNGAKWQLQVYRRLLKKHDRDAALAELVQMYYRNYKTGQPVHEWSIDS